jgi:hypothetical protein
MFYIGRFSIYKRAYLLGYLTMNRAGGDLLPKGKKKAKSKGKKALPSKTK